tara:strand:- start:2550 stop:2957 length:408 start_codon:yes stop_codon:yes gene_type:complete
MAQEGVLIIEQIFSSTEGGVNTSLQVGDTMYWQNLSQAADGQQVATGVPNIIGKVKEFEFTRQDTPLNDFIKITYILDEQDGSDPPPGKFIYFNKSRAVNVSSVTGYYSEVTFSNSSNRKIELFATSCDVVQSSK